MYIGGGVPWHTKKGGGLRCGHSPKKCRGLRCGYSLKKGGDLRCGNSQKKGLLGTSTTRRKRGEFRTFL